MIISAIIATYHREQKLAMAVESVLSQDCPDADIEVIVVNDSGEPLAEASWQKDPRVRVLTTYHTERRVAWNAATALSRGDYIHILGDDDVLLPGAYQALLGRATSTGAVWVYGWHEACDDDGNLLYTVKPTPTGRIFALVVAGENVPLQASLLDRKAFFASGGLDPLYVAGEDAELLQRVSMLGNVEMTEHIVARIRVGAQGATTTQWDRAAEMGRQGREKTFADPRCLAELKISLKQLGAGYELGRVVRYYWASAVRHARNGAGLTALSRLLIGFRLGAGGVLSRGFWAGLRGADRPS